jgi:methylase of polypeptide subunit release factors
MFKATSAWKENKVYTSNRKLIKELGLDAGLVKTIFQPCAELLVKLLNEHVEANTKLARILDIGCGSGIVGRVVADYSLGSQKNISVIHGIDVEDAAVDVAKIKTIGDERFRFWQANATNFAPEGEGMM